MKSSKTLPFVSATRIAVFMLVVFFISLEKASALDFTPPCWVCPDSINAFDYASNQIRIYTDTNVTCAAYNCGSNVRYGRITIELPPDTCCKLRICYIELFDKIKNTEFQICQAKVSGGLCNVCKIDLVSCDSFLVCHAWVTDTGITSVSYLGGGVYDPDNICPYGWGAPPLTERDFPGGNIINCKHNQGDCSTFPMTLKPRYMDEMNNDPSCQEADSCGLTSGRQLAFKLCVVQRHHVYLRFTFRITYHCPPNPQLQTCTQFFVWKRRP